MTPPEVPSRLDRARRAVAVAGIVLLGAALAMAPVAAFVGGMDVVSGLGIAGVAMILASRAWTIVPRDTRAGEDVDGDSSDATRR